MKFTEKYIVNSLNETQMTFYWKKMNNKLRQYKHNYDDGWWEKNKLSGDIDLKS